MSLWRDLLHCIILCSSVLLAYRHYFSDGVWRCEVWLLRYGVIGESLSKVVLPEFCQEFCRQHFGLSYLRREHVEFTKD